MKGKMFVTIVLALLVISPAAMSLVSARSLQSFSSKKVIFTIYGEGGKTKIMIKTLTSSQIDKLRDILIKLKQAVRLDDFEDKLMKLDQLLREYGFLPEDASLKIMLEKRERLLDQKWGDFKRSMLKKYLLFSGILKRTFGKIERDLGITDDNYTLREIAEKTDAKGYIYRMDGKRAGDGGILVNLACLFYVGGIVSFFFPPIMLGMFPFLLGYAKDGNLGAVHGDCTTFATWGISGFGCITGYDVSSALFVVMPIILGIAISFPTLPGIAVGLAGIAIATPAGAGHVSYGSL